MSSADTVPSIRDRIVAVLEGRKPDRLPFCDRLELWHAALIRQGRLPAELEGLSLTEVHAAVGIGQLKFVAPYALRLRGVEMVVSVDGEEVSRETDPVMERFPNMQDLVQTDRPGMTAFRFSTPVGSLQVRQEVLEEAVAWGEMGYLAEHPIKGLEDYATVQWILERVELVPQFDKIRQEAAAIGGVGFVTPYLHRIPFQEVLLDYLGEIPTFYALADEPARVRALMDALNEVKLETAELLAGLDVPYVQLFDNLTGDMTDPKLFAEYCLPSYQLYTELYHRQGKKVGSHTDGNLNPLLGLLRESGLDVCESFAPAPLSACTFDEAWEAWRGGTPIMWGVVPSPLLEERTPETELKEFVDHVFETVGDEPIILGVSDMVLGNNLIERVRYVAERVEEHAL